MYWCEKARKHMCVTDRHDMTLAVKAVLNLIKTNQPTSSPSSSPLPLFFFPLKGIFSFSSNILYAIKVAIKCFGFGQIQKFYWKRVSLPNNKILDSSKIMVFADDKVKVSLFTKFVLDWVENIVVSSIFSFSHNVYRRLRFISY